MFVKRLPLRPVSRPLFMASPDKGPAVSRLQYRDKTEKKARSEMRLVRGKNRKGIAYLKRTAEQIAVSGLNGLDRGAVGPRDGPKRLTRFDAMHNSVRGRFHNGGVPRGVAPGNDCA